MGKNLGGVRPQKNRDPILPVRCNNEKKSTCHHERTTGRSSAKCPPLAFLGEVVTAPLLPSLAKTIY